MSWEDVWNEMTRELFSVHVFHQKFAQKGKKKHYKKKSFSDKGFAVSLGVETLFQILF